MDDSNLLHIDDRLSVPRAELSFRASRSGGPGGQHVNTSSTRVELLWDVDASPSLDDAQRDRIRRRLANRISNEGILLLASSEHRSQLRNREAATERFVELLAGALRVATPRKKTRTPRAAKEARLRSKKHRSATKRMRGSVGRDE
jgi:ribosome-associated protein